MKLRMLRSLILVVPIAFMTSSAVSAENFPSRPIKLIVPASASSSVDAIARFISDSFSERLHVPVVVDRPGAGGLIAYTSVAKSAPDGYTLILSAAPLYTLPFFLNSQVTFDAVKDFTPIARVARTPNAIVVGNQSPYRDLSGLIKAMRENPTDVTFATQGAGSAPHLCASILQQSTKTAARHVPYKQTSAGLTDVMSGLITFTCVGTASIAPLTRAGKIRALAITSEKRWAELADVPTIGEIGIKGFHITPGVQVMGPANLPESISRVLSDAVVAVASSSQFKAFLERSGME
jgi:tripartite-type tricarboxylate transporter receptor subunit TctC